MRTTAEYNRSLMDPGDVEARPDEVCRHGRTGYCHDDALPAEREAVEHLYRHAFDYSHDDAYAAWVIEQAWVPGAVYVSAVSHRLDYEKWRAQAVDTHSQAAKL